MQLNLAAMVKGFSIRKCTGARITDARQPVPEVGKKEPIRKEMALDKGVKHTVAIGWPPGWIPSGSV